LSFFVKREIRTKELKQLLENKREYTKLIYRSPFILKDVATVPRFTWNSRRFKKNFIFFENPALSQTISDQLTLLRKRNFVEVIFFKHFFLKGVAFDKDMHMKKYYGLLISLRKKKAGSCVIFKQLIDRNSFVIHRLYPFSPNVLGIFTVP